MGFPSRISGSLLYLILGMDAIVRKEDGRRFHVEHVDLNESVKVLSESGFYALTGEQIVVPSGEYRVVSTSTESDIYHYTNTGTFLTNMATRETIPAKFGGYAHYDFLAGPPGYYLINDGDYAAIASGLTPDWLGTIAFSTLTERTVMLSRRIFSHADFVLWTGM